MPSVSERLSGLAWPWNVSSMPGRRRACVWLSSAPSSPWRFHLLSKWISSEWTREGKPDYVVFVLFYYKGRICSLKNNIGKKKKHPRRAEESSIPPPLRAPDDVLAPFLIGFLSIHPHNSSFQNCNTVGNTASGKAEVHLLCLPEESHPWSPLVMQM